MSRDVITKFVRRLKPKFRNPKLCHWIPEPSVQFPKLKKQQCFITIYVQIQTVNLYFKKFSSCLSFYFSMEPSVSRRSFHGTERSMSLPVSSTNAGKFRVVLKTWPELAKNTALKYSLKLHHQVLPSSRSGTYARIDRRTGGKIQSAIPSELRSADKNVIGLYKNHELASRQECRRSTY